MKSKRPQKRSQKVGESLQAILMTTLEAPMHRGKLKTILKISLRNDSHSLDKKERVGLSVPAAYVFDYEFLN